MTEEDHMKNYYWDTDTQKFTSVYQNDVEIPGEVGYNELKIGEPIIIQYLRFHIFNERLKHKKMHLNMDVKDLFRDKMNEVIITTHIKSEPQKVAAPEMVNYFNDKVITDNGRLNISDFGANKYGHELCYYDEHYKGQNIRLTVSAFELDKINSKDVEIVQNTLSSFSDLPYISQFKLPDGLIGNVLSLVSNTYNLINKDDMLIEPHDFDLFFEKTNRQKLRSGRYLLIQDNKNDEPTVTITNLEDCSLDNENRLIKDGEEVTGITYVVLQVNSDKVPKYKKFNLYQSASEFLSLMNTGIDKEVYLDNLTKMVFDYNDIDMMMKSEKLIKKHQINYPAMPDEENDLLKAYINSMSDEMKEKYNNVIVQLK